MKDRNIFFVCVVAGGLTGIISGAVIINLPYVDVGYFRLVNEETSCRGIEKYYSGEGFIKDVNKLNKIIWSYNHSSESPGQLFIATPGEVDYPFWDCEDSTHAFWCMAKLYNITCTIYYTKQIGRRSDRLDHLGLECFVDGGWMEIN